VVAGASENLYISVMYRISQAFAFRSVSVLLAGLLLLRR
jgi:hypothetical protein